MCFLACCTVCWCGWWPSLQKVKARAVGMISKIGGPSVIVSIKPKMICALTKPNGMVLCSYICARVSMLTPSLGTIRFLSSLRSWSVFGPYFFFLPCSARQLYLFSDSVLRSRASPFKHGGRNMICCTYPVVVP